MVLRGVLRKILVPGHLICEGWGATQKKPPESKIYFQRVMLFSKCRMDWRSILACGASFVAAQAFGAVSGADTAFFEQKIRPVLVEKCYECHSAEAQKNNKLKGGLFLDTRAGVLKGGDTGPALVPGNAKDSLLMKVVNWSDPDMQMPPKKKLPPEVIADFEAWIAQGAVDPREGEAGTAKRVINVEEGKKHWAFQPLAVVKPPEVKQAARVRTPVDRFVFASQEAAGITAAPAASKERLVRRAYFDLTGLPPAPEEIDAFVQDTAPDAFSKLVDRLLASPQYGERWARHWLDVVRYGESGGYEFDAFRPGAYHYRDWVIRSLNEDLPYDEFVRRQFAGDGVEKDPVLAAASVGFLVAGPYPGQITAKTVERIRYDQLDDMLSTTGGAMLGLTLGCVRCHDHKYDSIPQTDYYALAANLASTVHGEIKIKRNSPQEEAKKPAYEAKSKEVAAQAQKFSQVELEPRLAAWRQAEAFTKARTEQGGTPWQVFDVRAASADNSLVERDGDGLVIHVNNRVKDDVYLIKVRTFQTGIRSFRIDAFAHDKLPGKGPGLADNGNFSLGNFKVTARPLAAGSKLKPVTPILHAGTATFEQKGYPLSNAVDNSPNSFWAIASKFAENHAASFRIEGDPLGFEGGTELEFELKFSGSYGMGRVRLGFSVSPELPTLEAPVAMQDFREIVALVPEGQAVPADLTRRESLMRWFGRFDEKAGAINAAQLQSEKMAPKPEYVPVYTVKNGGGAVYHLRRGEVDAKIGKADPGFIQVLSRAEPDRWIQKASGNPRMALAQWMTDAEAGAGPLLARVMVNRVWLHHFGRALVGTPNDFGVQGEKPTHPELLDYLSGELIRSGWRLKALHRLIMNSAVYQLGVSEDAAARKVDPDNKLWWQRSSQRLEAEAIRDALLKISGGLKPDLFGPSEARVESSRRSVYLRVKRSELVPFLTLFDAPEPTQSVGSRGVTTMPTQALTLLNSPFVRGQASQFAARLLREFPKGTVPDVGQVMERAFQNVFARRPTVEETARFGSFLQEQLPEKKTPSDFEAALAQVCRILLCSNEFIYVD